ncbi:MAG TPA: pinensin family lanthipeptide [Longimicrobium sp.]|nr:pinensin family lanthipeptide [Longimicrobium sp.]
MHTRKLRLNVEDLSVESFVASTDRENRGTVHGAQDTAAGDTCGGAIPSYCQQQSCDWTHCANVSCLAGAGCGGNNTLAAQHTCRVQCDPNPPIE